jgi:hypothetical protein
VTHIKDKPVYLVHLPVVRFFYVHTEEVRVTSLPNEETEEAEDGTLRLKPLDG